jgi:endonuclease/exonuclease/phosphatase family metal-dependent hydrolase
MRLSMRALVTPVLALTAAAALLTSGPSTPPPSDLEPAAVSQRAGAVRLSSKAQVWLPRTPSREADVRVERPFHLASFNVLGHSHTARGGNKPGFAGSHARMVGAVRHLRRHHADVIGFQELQRPQVRSFKRLTDRAFAVFSGSRDPENSIAWRRSAFALVAGTTHAIPYHDGRTRHMPVVLLRSRRSGQELYVVNVHNPAFPRNAHWRAVAIRREVTLVERLRTHGLPVLVTGDLNARDRAFCGLTRTGDLRTPAGGSHGRLCRPPAYGPVDWIFGSTGVRYSDFTIDRATRHRRISDHPLVVTRVR